MTGCSVAFDTFFTAVHGHTPFPWQSALAQRVIASGAWPDVLDVPTGLGKTSVIDVAVWVAARTGCHADSAGRRRTFFVIDRRIVVDDVFMHTRRLQQALAGSHPVCREVAAALRSLCGGTAAEPALVAARMRGGVTWDWRWLDRPDRPAVVVGTVDQLGSRLLFRGYGLSGELAPIDAALVGTDSLIVIDEAHLSVPLIDTINCIGEIEHADPAGWRAPRPLILTMSATLARDPRKATHTISAADRRRAVPKKRMQATKTLHLVAVVGADSKRAETTAATLAGLAERLVAAAGVQAVAVVCNTVGRARAVLEGLRAPETLARLEGLDPAIKVELLTGRIRPYDRERLEARVRPSVEAGRDRRAHPRIILVTTQTVEVGADLDFDALITESAAWDALAQRLGRLNRFGDLRESPAVVVHDGLESRLYGDARERTWCWLSGLSEAVPAKPGRSVPELKTGPQVGPDGLRALTAKVDTTGFVVTPPASPVLLEAHLDIWARTSPRPVTDVPVAPFLHGFDASTASVRLVWRSDLVGVDAAAQGALVDAVPPASGEVLEVPIGAFRKWVRDPKGGAELLSDLVGPDLAERDGDAAGPCARPLQVIRWRGPGDAKTLDLPDDLDHVRPDDLLVLHSRDGGCDEYGWAPESSVPTTDLGDLAGREPIVRLMPTETLEGTLRLVGAAPSSELLDEISVIAVGGWNDDAPARLGDAARVLWSALEPDVRRALLRQPCNADPPTRRATRVAFTRPGAGTHAVARVGRRGTLRFSSDAGQDPASTSYARRAITLVDHQAAVAERASSIATSLRLPARLTEAVVAAAAWHDTGKLDRRFQVELHAGDDLAADAALAAGEPRAKSGMDPADRQGFRNARRASGLPGGFAHEAGSALAVATQLSGRHDLDHELVRHLVASHHGQGRPLLPPVSDPAPPWHLQWRGVDVIVDPSDSIDWDSPRRFAQLNHRYGRWGLALLETIVRLADIGCSEEGT